jgi:hypothetical protein
MIYWFSLDKVSGHKCGVKSSKLGYIQELKKKNWTQIKKIWFFFSSIFNSANSLASGKENVRFPDSPDFENSPQCDVR